MTCIVGLVADGKVYLGGDSAGIRGLDVVVRRDPKVFHVGEFIIGFSGSFRSGQVLRNYLSFRELYENEDLDKFMETTFVEGVRAALSHFDTASDEGGTNTFGGDLLVGVRGRLFSVGADFQVGSLYDDYDSIGCGSDIAKGSLYSTEGLEGVPPELRINLALEAAETFSAGVRAPFNIISVGKEPEEPPVEIVKKTVKKSSTKTTANKPAPKKKTVAA